MTGNEMRVIRERLGINDIELGARLGYTGSGNTIYQTIRRYEGGEKPIPQWIAMATRSLDIATFAGIIRSAAVVDPAASARIAAAAIEKYIRTGE